MLHVDLKYTNLLSCHFEKFVRKGDYLFNMRCPLCGDSQTKKNKLRGYIYRKQERLVYKCHNCNRSLWLGALIKILTPQLYKEYLLETFKDTKKDLPRLTKLLSEPGFFDGPTTQVRFDKVSQIVYQHAYKISELPESHYCLQYVQGRKIPKELWNKLYYTDHYKKFLDEAAPGHDKHIKDDCRLVIPYYDAYGSVIAITGRALENGDDTIRYVTVRTTTDTNKLIYGLDRVDQSKPVWITEGPLDSLFLPNAVASGDANLIQVAKSLSAAETVLIFDNEPRNKDIVRQMERAIKENYSVMIWPEWMHEKDINAMVLAGYSPTVLQNLIHTHIHRGLTALTHLTFWKKVIHTQRSYST